jgi:hypothetical protein
VNRVLIAMPIRPDCRSDIRSVQWCDRQKFMHPKGEVEFLWVASETCERGRNNIIQYAYGFKNWDFTHILTMDDDVLPQPDMLDRLLAWDKDIVGGIYPTCPGGVDMWGFKLFKDPLWWHGADPPIELAGQEGYPLLQADILAGGCVLSRRKVFDAIGWPWSFTQYQPMDEHGATCTISEDVWFCKRATECGFEIYADVSCTCDHFKVTALGTPSPKRSELCKS